MHGADVIGLANWDAGTETGAENDRGHAGVGGLGKDGRGWDKVACAY